MPGSEPQERGGIVDIIDHDAWGVRPFLNHSVDHAYDNDTDHHVIIVMLLIAMMTAAPAVATDSKMTGTCEPTLFQ